MNKCYISKNNQFLRLINGTYIFWTHKEQATQFTKEDNPLKIAKTLKAEVIN